MRPELPRPTRPCNVDGCSRTADGDCQPARLWRLCRRPLGSVTGHPEEALSAQRMDFESLLVEQARLL